MRDIHNQHAIGLARSWGLYQIAAWTLAIILIMATTLYRQHRDTLKTAENEARTHVRLNVHYRKWNARMGGVYAPVEKLAPNPYLKGPNREVLTSSGQILTLVNPAYMTRMVFDSVRAESESPVISKLTSLKPVNPGNAPDLWERESLVAFERNTGVERSQVTALAGKPYLRVISSFVTEDDCLKCHAQQGYKKGDIRGAISIAVPLTGFYASESRTRSYLMCGYLVLWGGGCFGLAVASRRRSRHEEAIRASEDKFRTVCDWTQDWEYWVDPSGHMMYVSPSCEQISGHAPADFSEDPDLLRRIVHPLDRSTFEDHLRRNKSGGYLQPAELEFRIVDPRGEIHWIDHRCRPVFDSSGRYRGRRISHRDITEQKRLEEQLRQSQKMEAIGQFAGGIAHDFNNLLTVISGYGNIALMGMTPEDPQKENVKQILAASERAAQLTKGLLAFSRKQEMQVKSVDLNQILRTVGAFLGRILGENITLATRFSEDPLKVCADSGQIEQVLINLAVNARDAMPQGGVLGIRTEFIELDETFVRAHGYGAPGRYALILVSDTGRGIDGQMQTKIFEPFFTTKEPGKGTGLGLAIVFGIVKQHNGHISVYSELGSGTTFRILLPLVAAESTEMPTQAPVLPRGGTETILVAEDDLAVRSLMATVLNEFGYQVLTAVDGEEVVEICQTKGNQIALVLMDVVMPRMSGAEACQEIKKLQPDIKVLFLSGYPADMPQSRVVLGEGMELLAKPVIPSHLARKVREMLDGSPG